MGKGLVLKSSGYAGLGDLLLGLDLALALARGSGRSLVVDWRDTPYCRNAINLFEVLFNLTETELLPLSSLDEPGASVEPRLWRGALQAPLRTVYGRCRSDDWNRRWASSHLDAGERALNSKADWVVLWDHAKTSSQALARGLDGPDPAAPLASRVEPVGTLRAAIAHFKAAHFSPSMLGVHVRDTDEAARGGKRANPAALVGQVDQLMARHPASGLFLASDNAAVIAATQARHPCTVSRPKWMPEPGAPLHLAHHQGQEGLQVAADAAIDIWLLAGCDRLIYPATSSFSRTAARLSGLTDEQLHGLAAA
jgi:hypothetical protein